MTLARPTVESRGREEGCRSLIPSPEKAPKPPWFLRGWVIFVTVVVLVVVVGVAVIIHEADLASAPAAVPPVLVLPTVPTTIPYGAHAGPKATVVLTEPVDVLSLSVPAGWKAPAADPASLPGVVNGFAATAPALGIPLQAVVAVENNSAGIRLFAYQPAAPHAFVSVISFSSPTAKPFTPSLITAAEALAQKKTKGIAVGGVQLPVGEVLTLKSSIVAGHQPVVIEILVLVKGGRTIEVEMVSETNVAGFPPLFDQIAASIRTS